MPTTPDHDRTLGTERRAPTFIEQARREQILQATIETLAEVGYARASFAQIARRATISPALISYHFDGKQDLINQVVERVSQAIGDEITASMGTIESYSGALRRIIIGYAEYVAEHPVEIAAFGEIYRQSMSDPDLGSRFASNRRTTIDDLMEMFREGQAVGELRQFAPEVMATALLAAVESIPAQLRADPDLDVVAYGTELADLFEAGTRHT